MVVGKTNSSLLLSDLFNQYKETDIISFYFNVTTIPCCIKSPLRSDNKPSFGIYMSEGNHVRFFDYATGEHGGLMDLLCSYWKCNLTTAINHIYFDFISSAAVNIKQNKVRVLARHESESILEVKVRPWHRYDHEYWKSYGVNPKLLKKAEVYPVSHKIITKRTTDGKLNRMVFKADEYAYVFVERKEGNLSLKLYQPFNTNGFKWCSKMDSSVISLWSLLPETGDKVIICSSLKDALCITSQLGIPAIAPQGEGYSISDTAVKELKRRFKRVYISFDTDNPGISDSKKLAERTGFINVIPDLGQEKDFSDFFKSLKNKEDFKNLSTLFP